MDTYRILEFVHGKEGAAVLATIICVEGHAYRKEGAAMLLLPSGGTIGSISPGCLESDLVARVPAILADGKPEIISYNMRPEEDLIWGEAIGCGGVIRVLLEAVEGRLHELLCAAHEEVNNGRIVHLAREWSGFGIAYNLVAGVGLTSLAEDEGERTEGLYTSVFTPRPRLIIFGAGQDAISLNSITQRIGFRVVIADWREELQTPERFPGAKLVMGTHQEMVSDLAISSVDYVVVCSHQLLRDKQFMQSIWPAKPAYIGIMGSRKRVSLLLEGFYPSLNVHAPVGFAIGADGPEEIAVSIAAELIAVRSTMKRSLAAEDVVTNDRVVTGGVSDDAYSGYLFGSRVEQKDGFSQGVR